jgi:hypothetical protein
MDADKRSAWLRKTAAFDTIMQRIAAIFRSRFEPKAERFKLTG